MKKEIIDRIMTMNVGIVGRELCQVCGKFKKFSGWASAVGTHGIFGYVCSYCYSYCKKDITPPPRMESSVSFAHECVVRFIKKRGYAFCELCGVRVSFSERRKFRYRYIKDKCFLCQSCYVTVKKKHYVERYIRAMGRRRYLESLSEEQLKATEINLIGEDCSIKQISERIPEDKIQEDWDRRIKLELKRLSKLHGADYTKMFGDDKERSDKKGC